MIVVRLKGGLGNQMFQYAFGLARAEELRTELQLDLSALLDRSRGDFVYRNFDLPLFNIDQNLAQNPHFLQSIYKLKSSRITKWIRNRTQKGKRFIKEDQFNFQPEIIANNRDQTVYEGWFQSEQYFSSAKDKLRMHFTFKNKVLDNSLALLKNIQSTNAICLNVRRTDFLKVDNLNTTNLEYFKKAVDHMSSLVPDPVFYVFSDDMPWCVENLKFKYPMIFVFHDHKGEKFGNYLQLMSHCKHFIIPNSSFAWWAAWISQNKDKKVIAPKNWFNDSSINTTDLVPKEWIRL